MQYILKRALEGNTCVIPRMGLLGKYHIGSMTGDSRDSSHNIHESVVQVFTFCVQLINWR